MFAGAVGRKQSENRTKSGKRVESGSRETPGICVEFGNGANPGIGNGRSRVPGDQCFWEDQQFFLPKLPNGFVWRLAINTDQPEMPEKESQMTVIDSEFILKPRSVCRFCGRPILLTKCREMERKADDVSTL